MARLTGEADGPAGFKCCRRILYVKNDRRRARDRYGGGYIIADCLPHPHGTLAHDTIYRASARPFFEDLFTKLFIRRQRHFPTPHTPRACGVIVALEATPLGPQTNNTTTLRWRFALPLLRTVLNSEGSFITRFGRRLLSAQQKRERNGYDKRQKVYSRR